MSKAYDALAARFARANRVDDASGWLHWDQSVTMPPGGACARAEQLAVLAEISHELIASDITGDLLAKAEAEGASSARRPMAGCKFPGNAAQLPYDDRNTGRPGRPPLPRPEPV
jgi:Zn-dependent M32 family carboxypeptidase